MFEKTEGTNLPLPDQLDEVRDKIKVMNLEPRKTPQNPIMWGSAKMRDFTPQNPTKPSKGLWGGVTAWIST